MLKKNLLAQAVAVALLLPGVAAAEFSISGAAKIEYSLFTSDGQVTGASEAHDAGDAQKVEPSVKLFLNSDVGEDSYFHAEILLADDSEAASSRLEGGEEYSQYEVLREFYFDIPMDSWDFRLGKQQVVWGTADGIKLLDIINPTDFRELNQNTSEDSRIPIWMVNAQKYFDDGSSIQIIVSEAQPNFIAGLDADGDTGAPFVFKGVDSITGKRNGFFNIAPALSKVANTFSNAAANNGFDTNGDNVGDSGASGLGLAPFTGLTVDGFSSNNQLLVNADQSITLSGGAASGAFFLNGFAENPAAFGLVPFAGNANNNVTNLTNQTYSASNPTAAFEYMPNATFATFNTFAGSFNGATGQSGFQTEYVKKGYDNEANLGFRYKASTDGGINYSLNYAYHYDSNPSVNMSWHDSVSNEQLTVQRVTQIDGSGASGPGGFIMDLTSNVAESDVPNAVIPLAPPSPFAGQASNSVSVLVHDSNGNYYGQFSPNGAAALAANGMKLRFTETSERVNSLGGSFDMALDGMALPTVIRGEFLLDANVNVPVLDKRLLAIGDLVNSLRTEETDFFKYVIGVDVTVLTNLLVSTQLIQFYNLDFVDEKRTCTTQFGNQFDCSKYTGDPSTLHLDNGLKKGDEVETFVSIFLSKPFGPDVQHRWNNILILENDGGYWNRFDVEYSFSNQIIGTVEYNKYWGDEDTTFGQFEDSSNLQLGLKYIF